MLDKISHPRRRQLREGVRPKNISMNSRSQKAGLKSLKETLKSGTFERNNKENLSSTFEISSNPNNATGDEGRSHNLYEQVEGKRAGPSQTLNANVVRAKNFQRAKPQSKSAFEIVEKTEPSGSWL